MRVDKPSLLACPCPVRVQRLRDYADDPQLQEQWREVKAIAKKKAAARIETLTGVKVNPEALFDVQVGHRCGTGPGTTSCQ